MRRIMFSVVLGFLSMGAFAQHGGPFRHMGPVLDGNDPFATELNKEITAILEKDGDTRLGDMTVGDMEKMAGEISIAVQKTWYVRRAKTASRVLPGAGQFMTGDPLGGSLFLLGDAAVISGTLIGAYWLLPENVRSDRHSWSSNTFADYLPSIGVVAGGTAAWMLLRWLSSTNAEAAARNNIESGKVTFQPLLVPGMGMGFAFRY
jgi:hypothetical protein